jgi:hypothetical protein
LIVGGTSRYPAFSTHKAFLVRVNNSSPLLPHNPVKYYQDQDGDGFGNDAVTVTGYQQPAGYVTKGGDCDDVHNTVYPGATEINDGLDNNCNGQIDENLSNEYITIPALIQAEDWSSMQGVQTEPTGDEGGGQNVGYIDYGDWMEYKIHVPQTGSYRLTFRLASPSSSNPRFELRLGSSVLSVIDVPNTGGFQTYTNVVIDVNLPEGNHTIRLLSTGGGYWNINWLKFEIPAGAYTTIPAHIEAENWSAMQGVQTEPTSDNGGGLNVGYIDYGDWMDYQIHVPQTGSYQLFLRLATPSTNNPQFEIRDGSTLLATVNVPNTGGFQNWQTIMVPVQLTAGNHTIRLLSTGGGYWNINWLRFELPAFTVHSDLFEPLIEKKTLRPENRIIISPNPVPDQFNLELQNELQGSVRIELTALSGQMVKTFVLNKTSKMNRYSISLNGISKGTYLLRVVMNGYSETKKLIKL